MTTRETYSLLSTLAVAGVAWLLAGWTGVLILGLGMIFAHVDITWIEPEDGDFDPILPPTQE